MARASWIDPRGGERTFAEVAAEWATSNPGKRPASVARDEVELRVRLLPVLGDRRISSIRPAELQGMVNDWATSAAPRTVIRRFGVLRAVMNYAVDVELIARSPCRAVKLPSRIFVDRRLPSVSEVAAIADAMGPYRPMAYMGLVLGLRWGEVAGLRVGRLDLEAGTCTIAEAVTCGGRGESMTGPPKSHAGRRVLSMPTALTRMLTDHLTSIGVSRREAFVFPAPEGGHLSYANRRQRVWLPACRTVGHPELGFHDLRRANATGLVAEGVDIKTVQGRLGHSDPRLTLADAAERLGRRFMRSTAEDSGHPKSRGKTREHWKRPGPEQLGLGL